MLWHLAAAVVLLLLSFGLLQRFMISPNSEVSHVTTGQTHQNTGAQSGNTSKTESNQGFDKSISNTQGTEINAHNANPEVAKEQKEEGLEKIKDKLYCRVFNNKHK
jgi:hypothetical protein